MEPFGVCGLYAPLLRREFLTDQLLKRGVHKSVQALEQDVREWMKNWNNDPRPFAWTKTAEEILNSLAKYIAKISGAWH